MPYGSVSVSVVIPAYNAETTIDACLAAFTRQTVPPDSFEVIVVDDGSTDATRARIATHPMARLLTQVNAGPAAARNLGVQHALGEIILFTDADCVPMENWIEQMLIPFSRSEVVGVKGRYLLKQRSLVARFVQLEYEEKYDHMLHWEYIDFIDTIRWLSTCCIFSQRWL
jgi:glycosyltransferase involved in cell wall biosynthesis